MGRTHETNMHMSIADHEPDRALVALAQRGDHDALVGIMRRHNRRLFRTAHAILRNEADAEDAVQESYIRAFGALHQLDEPEHLSTWLTRIVVNESLRRQSRRVRQEESAEDHDMPELAAPAWTDPEAMAARAEIRRLVELAVNRLPDKLRTVFMLRAVEEFSVEETASLLSIPEDTVKTRLFRAREALKRALTQQLSAVLSDTFPFAGARCDRMVANVMNRLRSPEPAGP
jgi:RNA polymerase sigma-70 factor (ECF subfamily)